MAPSDSTTTAWVICPPVSITVVMSITVPDTEECTGTLIYASLSPTTVPT